jgi:hypothetical protein
MSCRHTAAGEGECSASMQFKCFWKGGVVVTGTDVTLEVMLVEWMNLRPKEDSLLMFVFEITDYSTTFVLQCIDWPAKACRMTQYPYVWEQHTQMQMWSIIRG